MDKSIDRSAELTAMSAVHEAIKELDDSQKIRVLEWAAADLKDVKISPVATQVPNLSGNTSTSQTHGTGGVEPGETIQNFLFKKSPQNEYQRVACLAYFLEKNDGLEAFKTIDISKANQLARLPKMSNPTATMNDATRKYQFFSLAGNAEKNLTTHGQKIVELLPDHIAVSEYLDQIRKKSSKKKSSKKKVS